MSVASLQDILPLVEQPSRYLGTEINRVVKDHRTVKLRMALAFPDLYEIGTSHFGLQILYSLLNRHEHIAAERVFAPGQDMEALLRSSRLPLMTLESQQALATFDIIGFSLLYELNYTNVLTMLDLAGIPFLASQRDETHPLVIAGGPCMCNPEPVADFFDAIVVGDGEAVILEMAQSWLQWKAGGPGQNGGREALLRDWSQITGVYVPAFFEPRFDRSGLQHVTPKIQDYQKVSRAILADLEAVPFPEEPILPFGKPVHDRLRLEVSRGCSRGCRFCQAGMIYRPVRERSLENLLEICRRSLRATGYEDISLLSLSTGDYGCIATLMGRLMDHCASRHIALSLPSIRAGTLTSQLMQLIKQVRKTGFTIAPEAGSQRLRDVINKNISRQEIVDTVGNAFELGWKVIKLYFMVGLPTETQTDLEAIVDLVDELRRMKGPNGHKGKINVSVATFIPKPATPFQWVPQISLAEAKAKIHWLQQALRKPGVQFKWQNPETSLLEGLWARGDRRLSRLLVAAYNQGCRFDGWGDKFKFPLWEAALAQAGLESDFYTMRPRNRDEALPWDHIDSGVSKTYLQQEWESARSGGSTPDCRWGECSGCGVCDFTRVAPRVFQSCSSLPGSPSKPRTKTEDFYKRLRLTYSKQGQARFFGHLELSNIMLRALRRAQIPLKYSEGFHPLPKVSFDDPLPIGMESKAEHLNLMVPGNIRAETVIARLNPHLPEGLKVYDCKLVTGKGAGKPVEPITYHIQLNDGFFDAKQLDSFFENAECVVTRTNKKGKRRTIDIKPLIKQMILLGPDKLQLTIASQPGKTVRPAELLKRVFQLPEPAVKRAAVIKMPLQKVHS